MLQGVGRLEGDAQRAVAGGHGGRGDEGHEADGQAAHDGAQPDGHLAAAEQLLDQVTPAHEGDAAEGAQHSQGEQGDVIGGLDGRRDADVELADAAGDSCG